MSEYGRSCYLYSLLKPQEWYENRATQGFWPDPGGFALPIPAGEYRERPDGTDARRPIRMRQDAASAHLVLDSTSLTPETAFARYRKRPGPGVTGPAGQQSRGELHQGRSLTFSYPTINTQVSSVPAGATTHNSTVARAFTKLTGAFVTFRAANDSLG